jgi:hypothetical protein
MLFELFEIVRCQIGGRRLKPPVTCDKIDTERREGCAATASSARGALDGGRRKGAIQALNQQSCPLVIHPYSTRGGRN